LFCVYIYLKQSLLDYQSTSRCINPVIETLTSVTGSPNNPHRSQYFYHWVDTSTGRLVVPKGMTHTEVSVFITGLIHLLVDW
jgi:hypothetical protein